MHKSLIILLLTLFGSSLTNSQTPILNEVVSSNISLPDEDGDLSDWIEIHNPTSEEINLAGYSLTDDPLDPQKWVFPSFYLAPNDYQLIWASGKNKTELGTTRTLISEGDNFRYLIPNASTNSQWRDKSYNDSGWNIAPSGFGYADGDDNTIVPTGTQAIFLRKEFIISDPETILDLFLHVDYDDAFVAYINGTEVARANINGNLPAYNSIIDQDHEAGIYNGQTPDKFTIDNYSDLIVPGNNVLAIQVHNISTTSSDLTIIPFLSGTFNSNTSIGIDPPGILGLEASGLHTNFKIASKNEELYLFDNSGNQIDEIIINELPSGISFGKAANTTIENVYFETISPNAINPSNGFQGIINKEVEFSHPGGPTPSLSLELTGANNDEIIRFTKNGKIPTTTSPAYINPISVNESTIIRAKIFKPDFISTNVQDRSYLININHDLPVVSLIADPDDFFDTENGIYVLGPTYDNNYPFFGANFWEDWERPINFSYFSQEGDLLTSFNAGVKIFGGYSRAFDQRSLSFFARSQYGDKKIEYKFFEDRPYDEFEALVLRNSGNDFLNSQLRDVTLTGLMQGSSMDIQAHKQVVAYLNGEYWGLYNIREKVNEHYIASRHNIDPDSIDLLAIQSEVVHGDNSEYLELRDFIDANNLAIQSNYDYVSDQIDIDNFILYQVSQIYFDNTDWPGNNIKFWRPKSGKWKWILFDTDFGFGIWNEFSYFNNTINFALDPSGPNWPNPPWSTLFLRKLIQNPDFKQAFVNRFADEMNSRFLPEIVSAAVSKNKSIIQSEVSSHLNRWGGNFGYWNDQVEKMKTFGNFRPSNVKEHILNQFNLPDYHQLNIDNDDYEKGLVRINNNLLIQEEQWDGDYFENNDFVLEAIALPGFTFSHWDGDISSTDAIISINIQEEMTVIPVFTISEGGQKLVINEINYNSSEEKPSGDWIEIYNPSSSSISLDSWVLKDNDDNHIFEFPSNTEINANHYLIIAKDSEKFNAIHSGLTVVGDFDFGLSNNDEVRLFDSNGLLHDIVQYNSEAPWPINPNGSGATLELISPELDNSFAENWASWNECGTPGLTNSEPNNLKESTSLSKLVSTPNPFSNEISVLFNLDKTMRTSIMLYNSVGQLQQEIYNDILTQGSNTIAFTLNDLQTGVYFATFTFENGEIFTEKWIKL